MNKNDRLNRIISNKPKCDLDERDKNYEIYGSRIEEAIEREDINNIGVIGYYGSGKTSIVQTVLNKYRKENARISASEISKKVKGTKIFELSLLNLSINNKTGKSEPIGINDILRHLRSQLNNQIKEKELSKLGKISLVLALLAALDLYINNYANFSFFQNIVSIIMLLIMTTVLIISANLVYIASLITSACIIILVEYNSFDNYVVCANDCVTIPYITITILFTSLFIFIWQFNKSGIKVYDLVSEIEIFEIMKVRFSSKINGDYSELNIQHKMLRSIESASEGFERVIFVIEDIDRFDNPNVLLYLNELSNMLIIKNKYDERKVMFNFIYCVNPDVFTRYDILENNENNGGCFETTSEQISKFFDYMIFMIPVTDKKNSYNAFMDKIYELRNCFYKSVDNNVEFDIQKYAPNKRVVYYMLRDVGNQREINQISNQYLVLFERISKNMTQSSEISELEKRKILFYSIIQVVFSKIGLAIEEVFNIYIKERDEINSDDMIERDLIKVLFGNNRDTFYALRNSKDEIYVGNAKRLLDYAYTNSIFTHDYSYYMSNVQLTKNDKMYINSIVDPSIETDYFLQLDDIYQILEFVDLSGEKERYFNVPLLNYIFGEYPYESVDKKGSIKEAVEVIIKALNIEHLENLLNKSLSGMMYDSDISQNYYITILELFVLSNDIDIKRCFKGIIGLEEQDYRLNTLNTLHLEIYEEKLQNNTQSSKEKTDEISSSDAKKLKEYLENSQNENLLYNIISNVSYSKVDKNIFYFTQLAFLNMIDSNSMLPSYTKFIKGDLVANASLGKALDLGVKDILFDKLIRISSECYEDEYAFYNSDFQFADDLLPTWRSSLIEKYIDSSEFLKMCWTLNLDIVRVLSMIFKTELIETNFSFTKEEGGRGYFSKGINELISFCSDKAMIHAFDTLKYHKQSTFSEVGFTCYKNIFRVLMHCRFDEKINVSIILMNMYLNMIDDIEFKFEYNEFNCSGENVKQSAAFYYALRLYLADNFKLDIKTKENLKGLLTITDDKREYDVFYSYDVNNEKFYIDIERLFKNYKSIAVEMLEEIKQERNYMNCDDDTRKLLRVLHFRLSLGDKLSKQEYDSADYTSMLESILETVKNYS